MSIAQKPGLVRYERGSYEVTLVPVAFRASERHSWRSYEAGNRKYRFDFDRHFYTTHVSTRDLTLYIIEERFAGVKYEAHCRQCGCYTVAYFPAGWTPKETLQITCTDCLVKNTSADLPQDGMRYYTPEYQGAMAAAMRGK